MKEIEEDYADVVRKISNIFRIPVTPFFEMVVRFTISDNIKIEIARTYDGRNCFVNILYRQYGGYDLWDIKPLNFKSFEEVISDFAPEIQKDILFNLDLFV